MSDALHGFSYKVAPGWLIFYLFKLLTNKKILVVFFIYLGKVG